MGPSANRRESAFAGVLALGLLALIALSLAVPLVAVHPAFPAAPMPIPNLAFLPWAQDRRPPDPFSPANGMTGRPDLTIPDASGNGTNATKPPMGWNSWNQFACGGLDETLIRETADAMVSSGLLAAGYDTLTLDDCWSAVSRDSAGNLTNDPVKFPSGMKAIGDYIHARGLRYGIYASIGTSTCTGHTAGSLNHETRDVATFASWGVDYVKADRCNASGLVMKDIYARWRDAIVASGRPIVLSASDNTPTDEPWAWGPVTARQWRMSGDISDNWASMIGIFDQNAAHAAATMPGHFNDPDMLEVGNGGMTDTEYRTHLGLWALMSAPLIAGNDVRNLSDSIRTILTNPEVIAVDQDAFSFQTIEANDSATGQQVWYKPLSEIGGRAVGLLNRGNSAATIAVDWDSIGLAPGGATVRDLWARTDRGTFTNEYNVSVPPHGIALLRIVGTDRTVTSGSLSDQPWTYMANEWGPVERNLSNGGQGAGDGRTLTLNGVSYANGLGTFAPSSMEFRMGPACSTFTADVGVDDEIGNRGSVIFQVLGDGQKLFETGVMTGTNATAKVNVSISGVHSLRLQTMAVDATSYDSGDWANATVTCPTQPNAPPHAAFTASAFTVRPGDLVTFDASALRDPDGTIGSYYWDFGDGSWENGTLIFHAYARSGRFPVVLTVVDDKGASDGATKDIVADDLPKAAFSVNPNVAFRGVPIRFDASNSTDSDGVIVAYNWDFGDSATWEGLAVSHFYVETGRFAVRLVVNDDLGGTNETSMTVEIGNRPPAIVSTFPAANVVLTVSESGTFVVAASDPDGDPLTFSWAIGGVRTGSSASSYTFESTVRGTFVLGVTASDGSAATSFEWHIDVRDKPVTLPPPPSAELPGTLASLGVVTMAVMFSVILHALRSR